MTRKMLANRYRIGVLIFGSGGLLILAIWLGPKLGSSRKQYEPPGDANVSLLILTDSIGPDGLLSHHQLLRVGLRDGEVLSPETVWEGEADHFNFFGHRIVEDRYVVAASGTVIDVWANELIHDCDGVLLEIADCRVITRIHDPIRTQGIFAFDLHSHKVERIAWLDEGKYGLPGTRSPDGTKSIKCTGSSLSLHRVGQQPQTLVSDLPAIKQSEFFSPLGGVPPILWLDDDRFLTQSGNDKLIAVSLDGKQTPVVQFQVEKEIVGSPQLYRDVDGRIIYGCGSGHFVIDAVGGTWERCEWARLGHSFEASWQLSASTFTILYQGKEIGRTACWPHWPGRVATVDGYLALLSMEQSEPVVRIWSATTGEWTRLDMKASYLIGWMSR